MIRTFGVVTIVVDEGNRSRSRDGEMGRSNVVKGSVLKDGGKYSQEGMKKRKATEEELRALLT